MDAQDLQRGSIWRKWDLHVHPPGTKLSDGYGGDWDGFCEAVRESDVSVLGIADYFSLNGYFTAIENYRTRYGDDGKVFIPNLELRLNEAVTGEPQFVDFHLLFRPDETKEDLDRFLGSLKTTLTGEFHEPRSCAQLSSGSDYASATVTRQDIKDALATVFGDSWRRRRRVLLVVPANNSGIRAASGRQRQANLADQIDRFAHAIFGAGGNRDWFLREDRPEDATQKAVPKPVFACSDAHSVRDLRRYLGKPSIEEGATREVTWIKADPTFEGLLQTLVEPKSRVAIQTLRPDEKEHFRVIAAVNFRNTHDFPARVVFNPNLVSIIGSRSSGKSALLAHVAHAVDSDYTIQQQRVSGGQLGPAPGYSWSNLRGLQAEVEWGDGSIGGGKVVYVPQNALFTMGQRRREVDRKIAEVLFKTHPALDTHYDQHERTSSDSEAAVRSAVEQWFAVEDEMARLQQEIKLAGDVDLVQGERTRLYDEIGSLQATANLTSEEQDTYQRVLRRLSEVEASLSETSDYATALQDLITAADESESGVSITITTSVVLGDLPSSVTTGIEALFGERSQELRAEVIEVIRAALRTQEEEAAQLTAERESLLAERAPLDAKSATGAAVQELLGKVGRLDVTIRSIASLQLEVTTANALRDDRVARIQMAIANRNAAVQQFVSAFEAEAPGLGDVEFFVEKGGDPGAVAQASSRFNRQENTAYFDRSRGELIDLQAVHQDVSRFLTAIRRGSQKLRQGESRAEVAAAVLNLSEGLAFGATMESDRIGGFEPTQMTPGKQALFALTLLLHESSDPWPLLIDQPEDDLDSRSIFQNIVPYLARRKTERQIIMVTHDANLAIGADSEQVLIANRHGRDARNRGDRTFDYSGGALENTRPPEESEYILESMGVREHACDILDGGVEAFLKRQEIYSVSLGQI